MANFISVTDFYYLSSSCFIQQFLFVKAGLHWNANMNAACENDAYVHVSKFVDCSAFAEAANRPYINVLYANSLWCTDSQRIAFGCLPNVCHTAECCLPRLRNTSTSNVRIVFSCRVRILFVFRCKRGLTFSIISFIIYRLVLRCLQTCSLLFTDLSFIVYRLVNHGL